ncbi:MAG: hypothetical protein LBC52_03160 [Treponema sp.]|jgi:hypothetical protein|nr:hypothetical protein [Treponema sp.]
MKLFFFIFVFIALMSLGATSAFALPYIPGCPLHDSCVRTLKKEQRDRQREQRQRESPDAQKDEDDDDEDGEVKKPLGIILGFQVGFGDFNDKTNDYFNLRPSIAYLNSFGNFDFFAGVFYSLSLDDPGLSSVKKDEKLPTRNRGGIDVNIGYTFDLSERFTLTAEIDNQLQFDFNPDANSLYSNGKVLSYAELEPLTRIGYDLEFGDISLSNSFPFSYADDMALDYTVSLSFNANIGFGLTLSSQFWNLWVDKDSEYGQTNPGFQYGETELILNFWRGAFFASVTLTADSDFEKFGVEPFLSYRIKKITIFASVLFSNLGASGTDDELRLNKIQGKRDVTSVIPTIGVKLRF